MRNGSLSSAGVKAATAIKRDGGRVGGHHPEMKTSVLARPRPGLDAVNQRFCDAEPAHVVVNKHADEDRTEGLLLRR